MTNSLNSRRSITLNSDPPASTSQCGINGISPHTQLSCWAGTQGFASTVPAEKGKYTAHDSAPVGHMVTADVWSPYNKGIEARQAVPWALKRSLTSSSPAPGWARHLVRKVTQCASFSCKSVVCLKLEASGRGSWEFQFVPVASKPHSRSSSVFMAVLSPRLIFLLTSDSMPVGTMAEYRICFPNS